MTREISTSLPPRCQGLRGSSRCRLIGGQQQVPVDWAAGEADAGGRRREGRRGRRGRGRRKEEGGQERQGQERQGQERQGRQGRLFLT